jgi:exonuclease SbcC
VRPLKLELQGFTAFRDLQVISLEDLDLFVITGPTGAGKSSLLDAMVFALYGKVPRMGAQGLSDLVSHGLAEARISLMFSIVGERYRVTRRLSRTRATSATFEHAEGDQWRSDVEGSGVRAVDSRVVELLKLDFDAFTRAVVLPQGEFQRFLRGEPDKRRDVLTDLLGLKYYASMGARARARITVLQARSLATQEILDNQYAEATVEHLAEAKSVAYRNTGRADALAGATAIVAELDKQAGGLREARTLLEQHQTLLAKLRSELNDKLTICEQAQPREEGLRQAAAHAREAATQAQAKRTKTTARHDDLVNAHGTISDLARAEGAVEALSQHTKDLEAKQALLLVLNTQLAEVTAQAETARVQASELKVSADAAKTASEQIAEAAEAATQKTSDATTRLDLAERADGEFHEAMKEIGACASNVEKTRQAAEEATTEALAAQAARDTLSDEHSAAALAEHLKPGDPCPICHRTLDEAPEIDEHIAEALGAALARSEQATKAAQTARDAAAHAQAAAQAASERLERAQESLRTALGGAADVEAIREEATASMSTKAELLRRLQSAREEAEHAAASANTAEVHATTLETTLANKTSERERLSAECGELLKRTTTAHETLKAHFKGTIPEDPAAEINKQQDALRSATTEMEEAQKAVAEALVVLQEANDALSALYRELATLDADIAVLRSRSNTMHDQLAGEIVKVAADAALVALPEAFGTREAHIGNLTSWCEGALTAVLAAVGVADEALNELDQRLTKLATKYEVALLDGQPPGEALRAAEREARDARVRAEQDVQQAESRLKERRELEATIAEAQSQVALLKSLAAELRADRFTQFIIQQTLDLLAVRASEQLMKISADRYSLVSDHGEFEVIDHINADEQRSVKTLSGGETFLASLALALALSQHVGELATEGLGAKLEAVFIDEGFGSLDPDTLEDVIDALERLRDTNLMVGVITHVPALAQRIRVGIRIEKGQNRSTAVGALNE